MYTPPSNKKPVHLVKNFDSVPKSKRMQQPLFAQTKFDGVYAYGLVTKDDNRIFSRTGEHCLSLQHIEKDLAYLVESYVAPCVVIFEVYVDGWPVNKISGSFRRQSEQFTEAIAKVHDVIPYDDFVAGYSEVPYSVRYTVAKTIGRLMPHGSTVINERICYLEQDVLEHAASVIMAGGEGGVYKQIHGTWTAGKKNEVIMKIKKGISVDLEVVGVEQGREGKYQDTLGKLLCKWTKGRVVPCSGMTDKQRNEWWSDPSKIIGKIVKVDGMCLTPDGMIREPRFKEIRFDKVKADV